MPTRESYWQGEAAWNDRRPERAIPKTADFALIGGGYSGLATAMALRERNPQAEIVLLEAERVGFGASGRNAGFLSPVAAPIWLLGVDRIPAQAWAVGHLNREMHKTAKWISEHLPDTELQEASLSIEGAGRLSDAGLREFSRALQVAGLEHQLAKSKAKPKRLSLQMPAYTVHPYRLVRALADLAASLSVQICEGTRIEELAADDGCTRLRLSNGKTLVAGKTVVCTNAYTAGLDLGERVHAIPMHSFMLASAPLSVAQQESIVRDADFTVELASAQPYHRQHKGRILYGGIDKLVTPRGGSFAVPSAVQTRLEAHMHRSYPDAGTPLVEQSWSGRFHATPTGLPILRAAKKNPALFLNLGYGGTGVTLALVCAPLVAALASGQRVEGEDQARLLSVIQETHVSVPHSMRAITRLVKKLMTPWTTDSRPTDSRPTDEHL